MSADNKLLTPEARAAALSVLEGWTLVDGERLQKRFTFADFPGSMAFMVRVGFEAERLCHHPNWSNVYDRVDVEIWSHDLGGVSALCVELATAMDRAAG
ncbi:4a-hydroxytetrahydrobiopterin dehydratase [Pseudenhygromyxa sp. WMMC2535]|uniref:4a-hydroxytetrahydrobiopterin dehydratase n=1 Tax=Pseudenhygromyxa sp. WMMC2535 TaxID=2712867 RepID=UPI001553A7C2|nr:4a-hydroxytetrahydrobiopterin dehydratase [Pseudenhygromyxa sp. WMMC2535]NVB41249.1 4a-hydroxytetrahydrobiopterin dehydratase [Pseudenhygromyxa sp. WMMC2535]